MERRNFGLVILALLLVFVNATYAAGVKLTMWDWQQSRIELIRPYVEQYNKLNPGVTFELEVMASQDDMGNKLATSIAAGTPPDIVFFHNMWTSMFVQSLEPFPEDLFPLAKMKAEYVAFDQYLLKPGDRQFYFLPAGIMTGVIFYNQDFWDNAGLGSAPRTWDDFRLAAKKLVKRGSDDKMQVAGANIRGSLFNILADMTYQQGSWLFNETGTKANIDTPESLLAVNFMSAMLFGDRTSDLPSDGNFDIAQGRAAMQYKWAWYRDTLDQTKGLRYGVFNLPTFTGKVTPAVGRNNYEPAFVVPKGLTKQQRDAAFLFLKWLYDQDSYQIAVNRMSGRIPGKMSLWRQDQIRNDKVAGTIATIVPYTVFPGELPTYQWQTPLSDMFNALLKQTNSPESLLAETQRVVNARLAEKPVAWLVERSYGANK